MSTAIKAAGEGKVEGWLVRFTGAHLPDLVGDVFTPKTDFGVEDGATTPVYFDHGMSPKIKLRKLGRGVLTFKSDGVWIDAQLDLKDAYEQKIYELVSEGALGWSSGTAAHLTNRKSLGKGLYEVTYWPLGLDASLTPTPAMPLCVAGRGKGDAAQKMYKPAWATTPSGQTVAEQAGQLITSAKDYARRLEEIRQMRQSEGRKTALNADRRGELKQLIDALQGIYDATEPPSDPSIIAEGQRLKAEFQQFQTSIARSNQSWQGKYQSRYVR